MNIVQHGTALLFSKDFELSEEFNTLETEPIPCYQPICVNKTSLVKIPESYWTDIIPTKMRAKYTKITPAKPKQRPAPVTQIRPPTNQGYSVVSNKLPIKRPREQSMNDILPPLKKARMDPRSTPGMSALSSIALSDRTGISSSTGLSSRDTMMNPRDTMMAQKLGNDLTLPQSFSASTSTMMGTRSTLPSLHSNIELTSPMGTAQSMGQNMGQSMGQSMGQAQQYNGSNAQESTFGNFSSGSGSVITQSLPQ